MYAIFEDSGTQFKVAQGDTIEVDLRDLPEGKTAIEFDRVLMIGDGENSIVGQPFVSGAKVAGTLQGQVKAEKLYIQHFKRRKDSRTRVGHRQKYLRVRIDEITT